MEQKNQSGEEISLIKLIEDYFTKVEILTTRTYTVGDPHFGITDLYGKKISEAKVMSSVPMRTGRYRRADIAYTAQELLIAQGASVVSPCLKALLRGKVHCQEVTLPPETIDGRYAKVTIKGLNDQVDVEDLYLGHCKWNKVVAYTLTEMLERGDAQAVRKEISNVLRGYYDSLLHAEGLQERILINTANANGQACEDSGQEEKRILDDKGKMIKKIVETNQENFEKVVEVIKYVIAKGAVEGNTPNTAVGSVQLAAQEYIVRSLVYLYQLELAPNSYSRKHNKDDPHTPQKALFRALVFGAVNGNALAAYFLRQEAEKFPADSLYLNLLVQNKIVPKRNRLRRWLDSFGMKQYEDIEGLLPEHVDARLATYGAALVRKAFK